MRKAYLLVLTSLVIITAGMLASTLLMAQFNKDIAWPKIAIKLPDGTQDMNVSATAPYDIGDKFNITIELQNVTVMDAFGITLVWNSTYMNMTRWWSVFTAPNWGSPMLAFWTNDLRSVAGPWYGLVPPRIGAFVDLGQAVLGDQNNVTGTFALCKIEFRINAYGPHGFYIWKDPAKYKPWPYGSLPGGPNWPYLQQEAAFPEALHLPYCNVMVAPGAELTDYNVRWSKNKWYAPPAPLSGRVSSAMLWIHPPAPHSPEAEKTEDPEPAIANETLTVTVTQTKAGFNGTHNFPITNVTIDWGDGSPTEWMAPVAGVATFTHNYTFENGYFINVYCYAAGMPPDLAWYNETNPITVVPEFPAYLIMPLFLTTTIIAVASAKIVWSKKPRDRVDVK